MISDQEAKEQEIEKYFLKFHAHQVNLRKAKFGESKQAQKEREKIGKIRDDIEKFIRLKSDASEEDTSVGLTKEVLIDKSKEVEKTIERELRFCETSNKNMANAKKILTDEIDKISKEHEQEE